MFVHVRALPLQISRCKLPDPKVPAKEREVITTIVHFLVLK
jgi:hypothetical protein